MRSDDIQLSAQEQEQDEKANAKDRIPSTEGDRVVDSHDLNRSGEADRSQEPETRSHGINKEARS